MYVVQLRESESERCCMYVIQEREYANERLVRQSGTRVCK